MRTKMEITNIQWNTLIILMFFTLAFTYITLNAKRITKLEERSDAN